MAYCICSKWIKELRFFTKCGFAGLWQSLFPKESTALLAMQLHCLIWLCLKRSISASRPIRELTIFFCFLFLGIAHSCQFLTSNHKSNNWMIFKAPSTRFRVFLKTHLFYPCWVCVYTETAFSIAKNEAFRKRSPESIFLETPFSCSRVNGR